MVLPFPGMNVLNSFHTTQWLRGKLVTSEDIFFDAHQQWIPIQISFQKYFGQLVSSLLIFLLSLNEWKKLRMCEI